MVNKLIQDALFEVLHFITCCGKAVIRRRIVFYFNGDSYFGLCKYEMSLVGNGSINWKSPDSGKVSKSTTHVKFLRACKQEEEDSD